MTWGVLTACHPDNPESNLAPWACSVLWLEADRKEVSDCHGAVERQTAEDVVFSPAADGSYPSLLLYQHGRACLRVLEAQCWQRAAAMCSRSSN